jgi:alginate O-acetyltransferase complex protein AlgI
MIFSSVTFLFFFLPLVLLATLLGGKQFRNHILFAASLLFYLWGEGVYTLLLLSSIILTFYLGRWIEQTRGRKQKMLLGLGVVVNLLPLFICKYLDFTLQGLAPLLQMAGLNPIQTGGVHLPAGISFFTFQALSYLIDVQQRVAPAEQRLLNCGLYIAMFPQLIAGPIVRYHDIARQLVHRTVTSRGFALGAEQFVFGLAKKVLLADTIGVKADHIFTLPVTELSPALAWLGAVCFALQIYYDFSGYSDMAIGLGRMFGFCLPINFRYPYISRSMREFWRRWHISLSTWLRDYLYIPLGGSRRGGGRTMVNLLIVFLLCGLWHGANWTFVVWGLWHGVFLVLERLIPLKQNTVFRQGIGWLYTTLVVLVGWVIFRSPDLAAAWQFIQVMFSAPEAANNMFLLFLVRDRLFMTELLAGILLALPLYGLLCQLAVWLQENSSSSATLLATAATTSVCRLTLFIALLYASLITIAAQAYHPFLYFQF